jgi:hypothetical protein
MMKSSKNNNPNIPISTPQIISLPSQSYKQIVLESRLSVHVVVFSPPLLEPCVSIPVMRSKAMNILSLLFILILV